MERLSQSSSYANTGTDGDLDPNADAYPDSHPGTYVNPCSKSYPVPDFDAHASANCHPNTHTRANRNAYAGSYPDRNPPSDAHPHANPAAQTTYAGLD